MNRVLVVHNWGIGDWLMFSPVIKYFESQGPESRIDVILGNPSAERIIRLYDNVNILFKFDYKKSPAKIFYGLFKALFNSYDYLIFPCGMNIRKADWLSGMVRAKKKICMSPPEPNAKFRAKFLTSTPSNDYFSHRLDNNLRMVDPSATGQATYHFPFPKKKEILGDFLLHPGGDAGSEFKWWPVSHFVEVAQSLTQRNYQVGVILGPDETHLEKSFDHLKDQIKIYKNQNLEKAIEIVSAYRALVNADSGLGHIAAALGNKVFTMMGPGNPAHTGARNHVTKYILNQDDLDCRPCLWPPGRGGCLEQPCLAQLSSEEVIQSILEDPLT